MAKRAKDILDITIGGQNPAERQAKWARRQQEEELGRQQMMEEARVAEEEDRIRRKRARMLTGGRSLLIGTSPLGTQNELGGGGMYG